MGENEQFLGLSVSFRACTEGIDEKAEKVIYKYYFLKTETSPPKTFIFIWFQIRYLQ